MTIETKFNIGDEVWFMSLGRPFCAKIVAIKVYEARHSYLFADRYPRNEYELYRTKQELLDSL